MGSTTPMEFMQNAKMFQDMFVKPLLQSQEEANAQHIEEIKSIIAPVVQGHQALRNDVDKLQSAQKKAIIGYGVYASGLAAVLTYFTNRIKSYFHLG